MRTPKEVDYCRECGWAEAAHEGNRDQQGAECRVRYRRRICLKKCPGFVPERRKKFFGWF